MGVFTDALNRELTLSSRTAFIQAEQATFRAVQDDPLTPVDTQRLRTGIAVKNRSVIGPVFRATIESTAKAPGGFDYPSHLNQVRRMQPTKAKYLSWTKNGQRFFSKGFDNIHFNWWNKVWRVDQPGNTLWDEEMKKSLDRQVL